MSIPQNRAKESSHFASEKIRVETYFPFLKCEQHLDRLTCQGAIIPSDGCDCYEIRIDYRKGESPKVYIIKPYIEPRSEYHMYKQGNLCLYDPKETPWSWNNKLHETIIPWTAEWLIFYELWKLTGEWKGSSASHGTGEKSSEEKKMKLKKRKHSIRGI